MFRRITICLQKEVDFVQNFLFFSSSSAFVSVAEKQFEIVAHQPDDGANSRNNKEKTLRTVVNQKYTAEHHKLNKSVLCGELELLGMCVTVFRRGKPNGLFHGIFR